MLIVCKLKFKLYDLAIKLVPANIENKFNKSKEVEWQKLFALGAMI